MTEILEAEWYRLQEAWDTDFSAKERNGYFYGTGASC